MSGHAILLDVEGTTTPISFVYEVLFPFARDNIRAFIEERLSGFGTGELLGDLNLLEEENKRDQAEGLGPPSIIGCPPGQYVDSIVHYLHWLMDRDRKSTPLKSIQGRVWEAGYLSGRLKGEVFEDVPRAFERWTGQGRRIAIFSSGSVLAQRLLFAHTGPGDLTRFISGYFDTKIGAKAEATSYERIAGELGEPPEEIVFVSDVVAELDAARVSGMETVLCVRPGNRSQPEGAHHRMLASFDQMHI
jgi:enolase-phosphatase E1